MEHRSKDVPKFIDGLTVLPIQMPVLPSFPHETTHYMYIQPHAPKLPNPDSHRSLYLTNIPIDSTLIHFRSLFSQQLGGYRVEEVEFGEARSSKKGTKSVVRARNSKKRKRTPQQEEQKPELNLPNVWDRNIHPSGSSAVCVFVDEKSAHGAMKAVKKAVKEDEKITWGGEDVDSKVPPLGSQRYQRHLEMKYPSEEVLQEAADEFMTAFGEYEATKSRRLARLRSEPDEDGFITVTRGGKEAPAKLEEAAARLDKQQQREKEKADGMGNFYRFQVRERKKREQQEHQRKVSIRGLLGAMWFLINDFCRLRKSSKGFGTHTELEKVKQHLSLCEVRGIPVLDAVLYAFFFLLSEVVGKSNTKWAFDSLHACVGITQRITINLFVYKRHKCEDDLGNGMIF